MGEAKAKKSQVFRITVPGEQRHALFQSYSAVTSRDVDREKRRAISRTYAAFELQDFKAFRPEQPDDPTSVKQAQACQDAWDAKREAMGATVTVTREAVDTAAWLIGEAMKKDSFTARGIVIIDDLEELLQECKDGRHGIDTDSSDEPAAP